MALSYPLDFTSLKTPASVAFKALSSTSINRSPFTLEQTAYTWPGTLWEIDVVLPPMLRADAEDWVGSLVALNGSQGTFNLGDPKNTSLRGNGSGSPQINGSHNAGVKTISTKNWSGTTDVVVLGDWLQIGNYIYKVTEDATASAGNATIEIWPSTRTSLSDSTAITISNTKGLWRLIDKITDWSMDPEVYQIQFSAMEAI